MAPDLVTLDAMVDSARGRLPDAYASLVAYRVRNGPVTEEWLVSTLAGLRPSDTIARQALVAHAVGNMDAFPRVVRVLSDQVCQWVEGGAHERGRATLRAYLQTPARQRATTHPILHAIVQSTWAPLAIRHLSTRTLR